MQKIIIFIKKLLKIESNNDLLNDGTAYLRSLMHVDGNIRYANYQSESQMNEYLIAQSHVDINEDIIGSINTNLLV